MDMRNDSWYTLLVYSTVTWTICSNSCNLNRYRITDRGPFPALPLAQAELLCFAVDIFSIRERTKQVMLLKFVPCMRYILFKGNGVSVIAAKETIDLYHS